MYITNPIVFRFKPMTTGTVCGWLAEPEPTWPLMNFKESRYMFYLKKYCIITHPDHLTRYLSNYKTIKTSLLKIRRILFSMTPTFILHCSIFYHHIHWRFLKNQIKLKKKKKTVLSVKEITHRNDQIWYNNFMKCKK